MKRGRFVKAVTYEVEMRESVIAILDEVEDEDLQLEALLDGIEAARDLGDVDRLAGVARACVAVIAHLTGDAKALEAALMQQIVPGIVIPDAARRGHEAFAAVNSRLRERRVRLGVLGNCEGCGFDSGSCECAFIEHVKESVHGR